MTKDVDIQNYGELLKTKDHGSYDPFIGTLLDTWDDSDNFDTSDGYDDWNGFYMRSISAKDPEKYLSNYESQFLGRRWLPTNVFKKAYVRSFYVKARSFISDLEDINLNKLPYKKKFRNWIVQAKKAIRAADRLYEKDQFKTMSKIMEAVEIGRQFIEELKYLKAQGRIDA